MRDDNQMPQKPVKVDWSKQAPGFDLVDIKEADEKYFYELKRYNKHIALLKLNALKEQHNGHYFVHLADARQIIMEAFT